VSYKRIALVATLSMLAACGGDSTTNPIDVAVSGSLSFNYTGGGGGTFSATGGITSAAFAANPYTTAWAAGFKDSTDKSMNIAGNVPRTATTSDVAAITVKGQTTGTFNVDTNCVATATSTCNDVILLTGWSSSAQSFGSSCLLTAGSITISTLSNTNAVGSFTGSGRCFTSTGTASAWVVTNGSFNVPLLANVPSNLP
jgi:hypothetical protein